MMAVSVIAFSFLLSTALSAPVKVIDESTLFHGEDLHIELPSQEVEVTFQSGQRQQPEVVLMRGGSVVSPRAKLNSQLSHLILDAVEEADEGVYTVKNPETADDIRRFKLIVRDCSNEQSVKYGDNYHIQLLGVTGPITLEYRKSDIEANLTSSPARVLLTHTGLSREGYQGRISVNDRHITLSHVTGEDMGSYTVRDTDGKIQRKQCLKVKAHQNFVKMPYGGTLKINLGGLNSSSVQLHYSPEQEHDNSTSHLLMDKGELTSAQKELGLDGRLSVDESVVVLDQVKSSDAGRFSITDPRGFPVTNTYLEVEPYRLDSVYVAVIALLGLVVLLLLVCLLSCLVKVKKRAKRDAALKKIADNAGKEDEGDAFRQVVKNISKINEDSKHSQADNTEKSQSTEVDIKGLEVSSKEVGVGNLDTSDSGVGFNTTALPLDTDTDVPDQIPDSEAEAVSISIAAETKPSAPPAIEIQPTPVAETKSSPRPETKKTPDQPTDMPKAADLKPSPAKTPEPKPGLSPLSKASPVDFLGAKTPEPKPGLSPVSKASPVDFLGAKTPEPKPGLSPVSKASPTDFLGAKTPEPKPGLSPVSKASPPDFLGAKTPEPKPAPSPSPEPKPASPKSTIAPPESKNALTPTPEPSKPTTPEPVPITNGTPEPESKTSPGPADLIGGSAPKAAPTKTPEVELNSSSPLLDASASKDGAAAGDSTTTTTT